MFKLLFLLFLTVPLIEIAILIRISKIVGTANTIVLVISTAVLGALLLRHQGLSTLNKIQCNMNQGKLPAIELLEGLILVVAGALLLTPGFFTDILGFTSLIPFIRKKMAKYILTHIIESRVQTHRYSGTIIEGESQEINNDQP